MKNRIIPIILLLVVVGISIVGYTRAVQIISVHKAEENKALEYEERGEAANQQLYSIVDNYNNSRTFDIFYGDVGKISKLFGSLAGIKVENISWVDPLNNYVETGWYTEGDTGNAICFSLQVTDIGSTLNVLNKLELPIASLSIQYPGEIQVIFLTGGEV